MGKRRTAVTRHPIAAGSTSWAAPSTSTTMLVHVSREAGDPPTTIPSRPRTVGPRLHAARHGEYLVVPRRRA